MRHISASELQEWMEFFSVEGFESDKAELRNAQAVTMIVNAMTPMTGTKITDPKALILNPWGEPINDVQSQDELVANLEFLRVVIGRQQ